MSFRSNLLSMIFLPSLLLVGCGGGDGDFQIGNGSGGNFGGGGSQQGGGDNSSGDGDPEGTTNTSTVSYLPLSVFEKFQSYSGFPSDGLFQGESQFPLIKVYMINPISATTLNPVTNAVASDYKVTVDDIEIDVAENFPYLQKVVGNSVFLRTALVFDLTGSTNRADFNALVAEAKAYITKAKASSNSIIANQEYVIWAFGDNTIGAENVVEITSGFTSNQGDLELALDAVQQKSATTLDAQSPLHKAVVKVVGRYIDDTVTPVIDYKNDGDNDLFDRVTSDRIDLSQMVLFSSGPDNTREFALEDMQKAIESQGFLKFDPSDPTASTDNFTNKAVFYYVIGGDSPGDEYEELSEVAEKTIPLALTNNAYAFSDDLIANQISAIDVRVDLDNQYIYRYAFSPRQGDHTAIFSSRSADFNYSLTTQYTAQGFIDSGQDALGTPSSELSSLVEITGQNGEYLSGASVSLEDMSTFKAETRWTNRTYLATDYTWNIISGTGTGTLNPADGSYTVNTITSQSIILEVENTARSETAQITITN